MRRVVPAVLAAAVLASSTSAAPSPRPPRYLLGLAAAGTATLLHSADGVRWTPTPGFRPGPGTLPSPLRRGSRLHLFDSPAFGPDGPGGTLRRFAVGAGGRLTEAPPGTYAVQLTDLADAQRATPGSFAPSFAVDDAGDIVLVYGLRFEPETNACPVPGKACVKLRTATEVPGSDGAAFTGDPGNRIVISLDPADEIGPPALLRAAKGWAVLFRGPAGCLHALVAADPRGTYRNAPGVPRGCLLDEGPSTPSGLYNARLRSYRLYGIGDSRVVRAVTTKLTRFSPTRLRPLVALGSQTAARVAPSAPAR